MGKLYQCVIDRQTNLYSCWWCSELACLSEPLSVLPTAPPSVSALRSAGLAAAGTSCRSSSPASARPRGSASPLGSAWSSWPGPQHRTGGTAASRGGCLCFERWVPLWETWGQKKKRSCQRKEEGRIHSLMVGGFDNMRWKDPSEESLVLPFPPFFIFLFCFSSPLSFPPLLFSYFFLILLLPSCLSSSSLLPLLSSLPLRREENPLCVATHDAAVLQEGKDRK